MDEQLNDNDLGKWFSTYGVITAERILGRYQLSLPQKELLTALKSPFSFYHRILQIPLKNVLNGIVLQQANDYHVYIQKLFIDYLLSGESGKDEASQGASLRESIDIERNQLVTDGEEYHSTQLDHEALIASSQKKLILLTKKWSTALDGAVSKIDSLLKKEGSSSKKSIVRQSINHAIVHCDLSTSNKTSIIGRMNELLNIPLSDDVKNQIMDELNEIVTISNSFESEMGEFFQRVKDINQQARTYRTLFYDTILRVVTLIKLLPDYKLNPEQDQINRELLYFDKSIGEVLK